MEWRRPFVGGMRAGVTLAAIAFAASSSLGAEAMEAQARSLPLVGARHALESLRETCIELPQVTLGSDDSGATAAGCSVSSLERFAQFEGLDYYRAHYCLWPHWMEEDEDHGCRWSNYAAAAQAIFVGWPGDDQVSVLFREAAELGAVLFEEPSIIENRFGHWLHLNIRVDGTGHINASSYHHWDGEAWLRVESERWLESLLAYLEAPDDGMEAGLRVQKGVWPDLSSMTASIPLYRPGDCNACPGGGWLEVRLGFEGGSFVIEAMDYRPAEQD